MKRILIVGSNSYIGKSFLRYMDKFPSEYSVSTIGAKGLKPTPNLFKGVDCVFCTVGIAHIKETSENRHLFFDVNCNLVVDIANAAKEAGVKQFILMSSMSVYGKEIGCISKESVPHPVTAYGESKLLADEAIMQMADENFIFTCLRPPMVYGKDCKGNYQRLRKFSLCFPLFPAFDNQRSMIYIENLCEFVKKSIDGKMSGLFFPQNTEFVNTSEMVRLIAENHGKRIHLTKAFNLIIKAVPLKVFKKVFGNLTYVQSDTIGKVGFVESIIESERK